MAEDWEETLVKPSHPIWKILMGLVAILAALWGVTQ
jgi:hypothetical protein